MPPCPPAMPSTRSCGKVDSRQTSSSSSRLMAPSSETPSPRPSTSQESTSLAASRKDPCSPVRSLRSVHTCRSRLNEHPSNPSNPSVPERNNPGRLVRSHQTRLPAELLTGQGRGHATTAISDDGQLSPFLGPKGPKLQSRNQQGSCCPPLTSQFCAGKGVAMRLQRLRGRENSPAPSAGVTLLVQDVDPRQV